MTEKNTPTLVKDGVVVSLDYTLTVDDQVVDTSDGRDPLQFIQGQGYILESLERELYGMTSGDAKDVVLSPADGDGELEEDVFMDVPLDEFPADIPQKAGIDVQMRTEEGEVVSARIVSIDNTAVRLDLNHPLAGKEVHFAVIISEIRQATQEELEHGHVHGH